MANIKTNAVRRLDLKEADYILHEYDAPGGFLDGISVARATGIEAEKPKDGSAFGFFTCLLV